MQNDEHRPIVREYVRSSPILPYWLWAVLGLAAVVIAVVAF